jgi:hypothetical protein
VLCGRRATVADHYPETRRSLVDRGIPDPDAWHWLRPRQLSAQAPPGFLPNLGGDTGSFQKLLHRGAPAFRVMVYGFVRGLESDRIVTVVFGDVDERFDHRGVAG